MTLTLARPKPTSDDDAHAASRRAPCTTGSPLAADRVGHRLHDGPVAGCVRGVFERACNLQFGSAWWTICLPGAGMGSLSLRLATPPAQRLHELFTPGERVACDGMRLRSARVSIDLRGATVWRPPAPAARSDALVRNLAWAAARIAAHRAKAPNQLERAVTLTSALAEACTSRDLPRAAPLALQLVGRGEGLTPAGDDFLVGLLAGLDALAGAQSPPRDFCAALSARIASAADRTVPLSGCLLRLAAMGDFGEHLCALRDALLSEARVEPVGDALDALLAVGATSGADAALGLLAGLGAGLPLPTPEPLRH